MLDERETPGFTRKYAEDGYYEEIDYPSLRGRTCYYDFIYCDPGDVENRRIATVKLHTGEIVHCDNENAFLFCDVDSHYCVVK